MIEKILLARAEQTNAKVLLLKVLNSLGYKALNYLELTFWFNILCRLR